MARTDLTIAALARELKTDKKNLYKRFHRLFPEEEGKEYHLTEEQIQALREGGGRHKSRICQIAEKLGKDPATIRYFYRTHFPVRIKDGVVQVSDGEEWIILNAYTKKKEVKSIKKYPNSFGGRVQSLMHKYAVSKVDLAYLLGVTESRLQNWIKRGKIPAVKYLMIMCKEFKVSMDYLLGLDT